MVTAPHAPPGAPRHVRLGGSLLLLALAQLIYALDLYIVFVALPDIGSDLGFSQQTLQGVISAYVVFAGGFLLLGGRAADLLGRRRMFVLALLVYAGSSLIGGLAPNTWVMLAARAAQGIGGALLLPATLSLISGLFPEGVQRNRALAVWGGAGASGLSLGALLGGVLTQAYGWPSVFFVNVPLAGLVAVAALVLIPADEPRDRTRRFDAPGALTITASATLLVFALVEGPELGWTSPVVAGTGVAGLVLLAGFVAIERRSADPLLPLRLLHNGALRVGAATTFTFMATFGTLPYFLTILLQSVWHMSALETGLAFLVPSITTAIGTQLGERLVNRMPIKVVLVGGFVGGVVGTLATAVGYTADGGYPAIVPGLVMFGLAQGTVWTAMWIAASSGVAPAEQGVASGVASSALNLGNAIGLAGLIAAAGTVGTLAGAGRLALVVCAGGMVLGALVAAALPAGDRRVTAGTAT